MFQAAVYTRASREDGDKTESETLANQRELIFNFLEKTKDITLYDSYNDDNYTGTNFNRPAFQRMMADAYAGRINCIIVKDLSRLGRDYIDVGNYIQRVFPKLKIRFIAINDNIDSFKKPGYDILMPVKNIFNEQYARDISTKIISTVRSKQHSGKFIGAFASYGYIKDPADKYHLLIDPYAASVVRKIYTLFNNGMGKISIAKQLNNEGILCPSEYKRASGQKYCNSKKLEQTNYWTYSTVNNVLKNRMYAGDMVQHKANNSKFDYSGKDVSKDEWIIVENTHEPIIPRAMWEQTQDMLKRRGRTTALSKTVSLFAGFLVCGDCGRAMSKTTKGDNVYYVCGTHKRCSSKLCTAHRIQHNTLKNIIITDINLILSKIEALNKIVEAEEQNNKEKQAPNKKSQLHGLTIQLDKLKARKRSLYDDYKEGLIDKEEYIIYKSDCDSRISDINTLIDRLSEETEPTNTFANNSFINQLKDTSKINDLNRIILSTFYEKIIVYEDKKIELKYKHSQIISHLKTL